MSLQLTRKACCLIALFFVCASRSWADAPPDRYGDIPSDSIAVASIDLKALRESPSGEMIPWEIADVACREQLGFSLESVDSVDVTVGMPSPLPEVGVSIRFNRDVDIVDLLDKIAGPIETSPKDESLRFRDVAELPQVRIAQKEGRRVLVGTQGTLRRMLSQRIQTGGTTVQLVQSSEAPIRMALNFAKVRDLASMAYEQASQDVPESMRDDIADMISLIDNFLVEVRPMSTEALHVSAGATSGPNADTLLHCMNRLRSEILKMTRENLEVQLDDDESISDAMRTAILGYSQRMQNVFDEQEFWTLEDDRVHLKVANSIMSNYTTVGILTGLLLPAVQSAREAARRMSSSNNLRQIMLSLLNYESAYREFPGRVVKSEDGQPLLSWRVMVLPFLDEEELFKEFHLDEPWDSEHNIRLLERMPAVYANPRVATLPGHTAYLAPYGEDAGWPEDNFRISTITDGTSNTIAVVEASGQLAVPWTKPDDFDIDQPMDDAWMPPGSGANAVFFDGSVRFLSRFVDAQSLRAMFTLDGGESARLP